MKAPRGTVEQLKPYDATYDIGGVDIYPISYPPGRHLAETDTNREISIVGDYTQVGCGTHVTPGGDVWVTQDFK